MTSSPISDKETAEFIERVLRATGRMTREQIEAAYETFVGMVLTAEMVRGWRSHEYEFTWNPDEHDLSVRLATKDAI